MRAFVAVTDRDWFELLRARPDLDEVNFWQPSARRRAVSYWHEVHRSRDA